MNEHPLKTARGLRRQGDGPAAATLLAAHLREPAWEPGEIETAGRLVASLEAEGQLPPTHQPVLKVGLFGQFTTGWLLGVLRALAWGQGQRLHLVEGGFDQVIQSLLAIQPGELDVAVFAMGWPARRKSESRK